MTSRNLTQQHNSGRKKTAHKKQRVRELFGIKCAATNTEHRFL